MVQPVSQLLIWGDSGIALFRGDNLIWQSSQQEYLFNYPYQLSSDKDAIPKDADRHLLTKLRSGRYTYISHRRTMGQSLQ